jgi:hypothetical protein
MDDQHHLQSWTSLKASRGGELGAGGGIPVGGGAWSSPLCSRALTGNPAVLDLDALLKIWG